MKTSNLSGAVKEYSIVTPMNEMGDMEQSEDFSQIFGLGKSSADKEIRRQRAVARKGKADSKTISAKAQLESARALGKDTTKSDVALAKALGGSSSKSKKGMSMTAKVGIGVGVAVVLGIIGFVIYKKMKKK